MDDALDVLADRAFREVADRWFHRDIAMRQVRDLIEYFWVAVPLQDGQYAKARDLAERALAARKNVRSWRQVLPAIQGGWGAHVPKSSLDGLRESVLDEGLYDEITRREVNGLDVQTLRERYFVKRSERLCGIGLLKRVGSEAEEELASSRRRPAFHSTSHIASAPLRTRIAAMDMEAEVETSVSSLCALLREHRVSNAGLRRLTVRRTDSVALVAHPWRDGPDGKGTLETRPALGREALDGRLLYVEQIPALLDEILPGHAEKSIEKRRKIEAAVTEHVRGLLHTLDLSPDTLPTYYATLLADGDNMGKALDDVGRARGMDGHRKVAQALDYFSMRCRDIVETHAGSLIYAGGDDVLALLPLHTVLACARKLHDVFGKKLKEVLVELGLGETTLPSLSVGLGIGHHLDDMADVRALAKEAEQKAKAVEGKNALAILVQMRSGGRLEWAKSWDSNPVDCLHRWARLLATDKLSNKAAYDLETALEPLVSPENGTLPEELTEAAKSLATAVLQRKIDSKDDEAKSMVKDGVDRGFQGRIDLLSQELQIARLLGRACAVAFPEPKSRRLV
jgi:CRISPR-associated protein Cmr2